MELYGFENLTVQVSDQFGLFKVPAPGPDRGSFFDGIFRALQLRPGVASAPAVTTKAPGTSTVTTQPTARQQLQQVTKQPTATAQELGKAAQVVSSGEKEIAVGVNADVVVSEALIRALFLGEAVNSNTELSLALVAGAVTEASSGETGQVLQAAAELFSVVEHVTTTRSERTQAVEPSGTGVAAVVTHLESLLGVARQETVRPAVAQQLLQVARLMSEALPLQALPLVSTLVLQTRSEVQLTRLVQTLEQFFRLPESMQREILEKAPQTVQKFQQLVRQQGPFAQVKNQVLAVPASEAIVQVPETVASNPKQAGLVQTNLPQTGPRGASLNEAGLHEAPVPTSPEEVNLAAAVQTGALTVAGERPTPAARQVRLLGPALAQVVADLSTLGLPLPVAESFRKFLSQLPTGPVRSADMKVFVAQLLRHVPPTSRTMTTLLQNIFHRSANVRFLMVTLLKEVIHRVPAETAKEKFMPSLKVLARDRQSLKVRSEAIRVLLDMGQGQSKGRQNEEAMRALLEEIDLVPLLRDLLNPRNHRRNGPEEVRIGLSLLTQAGRYLHPTVRAELLQFALEIAERHRLEELKMEALGCLLTYQHDLGRVERRRLLQKGLYLRLMAAVAQRYQGGHDDFVSNNGPQAVRYGI